MIYGLSLVTDAAISNASLFKKPLDVSFENRLDADIKSSYDQSDDVVFYSHKLSHPFVFEVVIELFVILVVHYFEKLLLPSKVAHYTGYVSW